MKIKDCEVSSPLPLYLLGLEQKGRLGGGIYLLDLPVLKGAGQENPEPLP